MRIGVLALQGAFIEHVRMLEKLGAEAVQIRQMSDLRDLRGVVLPGGESTAMNKLLHELDMMRPLTQALRQGLPAFGNNPRKPMRPIEEALVG